MFRLIVIIFWNLYRIPYMVIRMRYMAKHSDQFTEFDRYKFAQHEVLCMNHAGKIETEVYGQDNLPKDCGYVMYPNHQGKYDATSIIYAHNLPCTFVMDKAKSYQFFVREMVNMLGAKRLELTNLKQGLQIIKEITQEVQEGKRFILFSEGGYHNNRNKVQDFKPGSFKAAVRAKAPIVPVCLIDSYKPFNTLTVGPVVTKVSFLKPLYYEEYKDMKTPEIASIVRQRIIDEMARFGINGNKDEQSI